ncbi:MAG: serine/threonine protein kinase [Bdellovibrionales bacterium]
MENINKGVPQGQLDPMDSQDETMPKMVSHDESTQNPHPGDGDNENWSKLGATHVVSSNFPASPPKVGNKAKAQSPSNSLSGDKRKKHDSHLGDFLLIRKLGQGAMATVYKARQQSFDRKVALKLLHKHSSENPKLVERFYREARILGQLDHPNIVQGYSVGEAEGFHYFAMEYISGHSLQYWLTELGLIPVEDAVHITLFCCRALEYAHKQGLVHRDVKPDNVLITREGIVKVADLGLVKALDEEANMGLTQTGHGVGTPWYMPLEQAKNSKDADCRSDIYALGCMLYCMLTGRPPFSGNNIIDVIKAKEIGTYPPARQINANVPDRLDLIILKMTAKQPKHRYQTCTEVIEDLETLDLSSQELTFLARTKQESRSISPSINTPFPARSSSDDINTSLWYLSYESEEGDWHCEQFSTDEILNMVQAGEISPDNKVSKSKDFGFRALATYKDFHHVAVKQAVRMGADRRAARFRDKFEELKEEELQRLEPTPMEDSLDEKISYVMKNIAPIALIVVGAIIFLVLFLMLFGGIR